MTLPGAVLPDVAEAVQDAILADFSGNGSNARVGMAQTLYASRFYSVVRAVEGVEDVQAVNVRAGTSGAWKLSVAINADREPVLERANISVVVAGA